MFYSTKLTDVDRAALIEILSNNPFDIVELGYYSEGKYYGQQVTDNNPELVINQVMDNKYVNCIDFTDAYSNHYKTLYFQVFSNLTNVINIHKTTIFIK